MKMQKCIIFVKIYLKEKHWKIKKYSKLRDNRHYTG